MLYEIKSLGGSVLYSCEADSFKECVESAVKGGAALRGATLRGANLCGADLCDTTLRGANLGGADLRNADLRNADLRRTDLRNADLRNADLRYADLQCADLYAADLHAAKLNWQSHTLLSHLLKSEAGNDIDRRSAAGIIAVSTDWCWNRFLSMHHPAKEWALQTLASYIVDGDEHPEALDVYRLALKNVVHVEGRVVPLYTPEEVEARERAAFEAGALRFGPTYLSDTWRDAYFQWSKEQGK